MIIEKVKMGNFGAFHGEHEISFHNNGIGVHLIRGNNGQGKTSIQRAILWCLYGVITDRKGKEVPPTSLLHHTARDDGIYQFYVKLFFNHDGEQWSIFRKMESSRHTDNKYRDGEVLHVTKDGAVQPNPKQAIERIIPRDVNRFFFFDGEMLRDYEELLDQSSPRMSILRDAIEHILGVPYFRISREDVYSVRRKLESERTRLLKKLGGHQYDELASTLQQITAEIEDMEKAIESLESELDSFRIDISDKMREVSDLKDVKELGEARLQLIADLEGLKRQKESKLIQLQTLTSKLYKIILTDVADGLLKQLELKHTATTKKYAEKQQWIARLEDTRTGIAASRCRLCNAVLDAEKIEQLTKQLQEIEYKVHELTQVPEPNHEFEDSKNILDKMLSENVDREQFKDLQVQISRIEQNVASKEATKSDIEAKLGDPKQVDNVRNLERTVQEMVKEQGKMEQKIDDLKETLLENLETKGEFERQLSSISRIEINELSRRIALLKSAERVFEEAISEYREEKSGEVEKIATEVFKEIRSKEEYDKLKINEQFGLSIVTKNNRLLDKGEWRSSGEEQLVAISLIGALNKCAQIKAPVLMDTPFGRLDMTHGEKVLKYLPNFSEQIILLVTDREFRKGDEVFLEGKIKSDYTVVHKGEDEGSFIVPTRGEG